MEKKKRTARGLLIWGIISYFIFNIASSIYLSYQQVANSIDLMSFPSVFHLFALAILWLFFIPLLFIILHLAKQTADVKLQKITIVLLAWLSIGAVFMLIAVVFAYVAPETFQTYLLR